jgi:hypothetical protein
LSVHSIIVHIHLVGTTKSGNGNGHALCKDKIKK